MAKGTRSRKDATETYRLLEVAFLRRHPEEAAELLERLPAEACVVVVRELPADLAARILSAMSREAAVSCLSGLPPEAAAATLKELGTHGAAALLRTADAPTRDRLVGLVPGREAAASVKALVAAASRSVAAVMDTHVLTVAEGLSIRDTRARFRRFVPRTSVPVYAYVLRGDQTIAGVVSAREVLVSGSTQRLEEIMKRAVTGVPATATEEAALQLMSKSDLDVLPVVDGSGVLLGQIARETLLRRLGSEIEGSSAGTWGPVLSLIGEGYLKGVAALLKGLASAGGGEARRTRGQPE